MSDHALNHRFRRLRAQAVIIRAGREKGFDMKDLIDEKDLPGTQEAVNHQSTQVSDLFSTMLAFLFPLS